MSKPGANQKLFDVIGDVEKPLPINYSLVSIQNLNGETSVRVTSDFYRTHGYECGCYHSPISKILNKGHESA